MAASDPRVSLLAGDLQELLLHVDESVYTAPQQIDQSMPARAVSHPFFHARHQDFVLLFTQLKKDLLAFHEVGHALSGNFAENRGGRVKGVR